MKDLQLQVRNFVHEHELNTDPEWRALDIVSEMGEVAKEILKTTDYGKKEPKYRKEIELEIGDVLFSIMCLANSYEIDIEKALDKSMKKYMHRIVNKGKLESGF